MIGCRGRRIRFWHTERARNASLGRVLSAPEATLGRSTARGGLAQATTYLASTAKSNASDQAYWAALSDVLEHGSLPVPNHLRNAGDRRMKHHGIGVGYLYPHDFEGHDVNQQYLPDKLHEMGRRYYVPSDQGSERGIGELLQARRDARAAGRPKRRSPTSPAVDAMRVGTQGNRTREGARKELAETEKRDAEAGPVE